MKVGLIGAGNMARALARGWGEPVLCADPARDRAKALQSDWWAYHMSPTYLGSLKDL